MMTITESTINELKRTIAMLKTSTAPRAKETVKLCRANIRWLRQREKHNGSK